MQFAASRYRIEIFWSDEDEGYIAIVPKLPGCNAWGVGRREVAAEIDDAIYAWVEACEKAGNQIPEPD